jgi:hypothetical protein
MIVDSSASLALTYKNKYERMACDNGHTTISPCDKSGKKKKKKKKKPGEKGKAFGYIGKKR